MDRSVDTVDAEDHPRKKVRPSSPELEIGEKVCEAMLAERGAHVPAYGTTTSLKLPRTALVARVIDLAEGEKRHVYIRGAPGTGKSVLLALVGVELKRRNKRVVFIPDARDLEKHWNEIVYMSRQDTIYLLVDRVHTAADSKVWKFLKLPFNMHPDVYIIATGIPDQERTSSLFGVHTNVDEILLGLEELENEHVVNFFLARLLETQPSQPPGSNAPPADVIRQVLRFAHAYTQGHAYPCLKLTEYFLTKASAQCLTQDVHTALLAVIASPAFLSTVYLDIFNRCYGAVSSDAAEKLVFTAKDPAAASRVVVELKRLGLWLPRQGMSLLLQYTVMNMSLEDAHPQALAATVSHENFGQVLVYALSTLTAANFAQLSSMCDAPRQRCEDSIGFFIGAQLKNIDGLSLSPQHALPVLGQRSRPPSVDFYINGTLDMFLALTLNGSLLEKHFQRFQEGGPYSGKKVLLLDIELNKAKAPTPLPETVRMYEQHRYTYVVQLNTLYRGTEVFHAGVRSLVVHT